MSGFVPIRSASSFSAGIVGGDAERKPTVSSSREMVADSAVSDGEPVEADEDAEAVSLPANGEELAGMLEEARADARAQVEAEVAAARADVEAERKRIEDIVVRVETAQATWAAEVRNVLGELVVVGVRSVVSESAELQVEMLRDRFAEIGERLVGEQDVVVRVRPEDLDFARSLVGDREGWQVLSDGEISGGLVAETEGGRVDATLGAALTGIAESVQEWQNEGDE